VIINAAYFYDKINEDLRMGGLGVQAEDIIDIIEGYKGKGYAISSQEELGKYSRTPIKQPPSGNWQLTP